ncbi:hypothetical protein H0H92_000266 [Tricholoma furcatifolium]|nr:hypothetical protein H0H92_000266 [Tricholoma furcatifolium]
MSAPSQPASGWTEPPWSGWIQTTGDALLILEAARRGLIPRVTRRLVDSERKMICSGSVFVFDEDESGIKRWTDGFFWSPSRILGNFLLYRETDKRGAGPRGGKADPSSEANDQQYNNLEGSLSRPKSDEAHLGSADKQRERTLMGSLTNSYKFKPDGLMKKTFSLTIGGVSQHLISYYKVEDVENGRLRSPSSLPELASLDISPEYLDKSLFRSPPKVEVGPDGIPRYRGEADEIDSSPPLLAAPLASGTPLIPDNRVADASSISRRGKRFEPYSTSTPGAIKRPRRPTKSGDTTPELLTVSQASTPITSFAEPPPTIAATAPAYPTPYSAPPYAAAPGYYPVPGYQVVPGHSQAPPHVYYPPPVGSVPPHAQPASPVPFQYPYAPIPPVSSTDQEQPSDQADQQPQPSQSPPPPPVYYQYPAQQPYNGTWPPYSYPAMSPHPPVPSPAPQSSIASTPVPSGAGAASNGQGNG